MLATYRLNSLPRTTQERLHRGESARVAQELATDALGGTASLTDDEATWYDITIGSTGTKLECKSTWERIGDKYPEAGRFRLRKDQTVSLRASAAAGKSGTAWYIFVLFSEQEGTARVRRSRPSTVARIVEERGGWNLARHDAFEYQHKLPSDLIF